MTQSGPLIVPLPEPDDDDAPMALDCRPDGRVIIAFSDDLAVTLRRPTLGEFRRWRTLLSEVQDEALRLAEKQQAEAKADADDPDLTDTERNMRRLARTKESDEAGETAAEVWWSSVFEALADQTVPEIEDWPPFLVYGTNVLPLVLQHWRDVPLAPGRRSNKPK